MEEKIIQVPNDRPYCNQKRRQRRFPWRNILAMFLMVIICGFILESFGKKAIDLESSITGTPVSAIPQVKNSTQIDILADGTQPAENNTAWNLILVNNQKAIPKDYKINLVEIPGGEKVDERIYKPLMEMLEAAKEGNWGQPPTVVSGYRTQERQQRLYNEKVAKYQHQGYLESKAKEMAEQWVAVPGYSEHQIGLAVDINGVTYDLYFWLQENSYKYGFIFRYPGNKTDITGVAEEVWHYRYVGVEAATEMHKTGICLEEYLLENQNEG